MSYRDDPAWKAAQAVYLHGRRGATATENLFIRLDAADRMHDIELPHEDAEMAVLLRPGGGA